MKSGLRSLLIILLASVTVALTAKAQVKLSVTPLALKPGDKGVIKATLTIPAGMHQTYVPGENEFFYLNATGAGLEFGATHYPELTHPTGDNEGEYQGTITLSKSFKVISSSQAGRLILDAEVGYNICFDTGSCEPPETVNQQFALDILPLGNQADLTKGTSAALPAQQAVKAELPPPPIAPSAAAPPAGMLWRYLLMAFLGGLILNIMPCVLPVLSIKAMSIVKQAHDDQSEIIRHSFAYMGGILLSFIALASVIVFLKSLGEVVGWGFQFQNTNFVLVLASVIFVFAMSLFDVFIINAPGMSAATQASSRSGLGGSFLSGIFAVLLATPCSAPMLGTALGFAFSQPAMLIFVFFILIGFGLAFPFFLLGLQPGWMKYIPKPGEWMNIFKEVMGFLLIGTVVWLLHVIYQQNGGEYLLNTLIYFTFLAFAVWLYGRFVRYEHSKFTQWLFTLLAVVVIAGSAWVFLSVGPASEKPSAENVSQEKGFEGWLVFKPGLIEDLARQGHPVFVDFGAKWCMTCITNEKTVITTNEMKQAFAARKVILVRGDFTKKNEDMSDFMKQWGRAGVPFNLLIIPNKPPVLFPELLTASMIKDGLEKIETK